MTIYIINLAFSPEVTAGIQRVREALLAASSVSIAAHQPDEGLEGIDTQAHVDGVVAPLPARAPRTGAVA